MVYSIHRFLLFSAIFALSCTNDNRGADTPADGVSLSHGLAGETTRNHLSAASPESSATDFAVSSQYLASAAARLLVPVDESEQVTFIHQNHLGSNTLLSDSTGQEKGRWAYTPYGSLRSATGQHPVYGFSNQEKDLSTGLLHFKYRYLDATNGRWLQIDPAYIVSTSKMMMKHGEATTAYAYVGNQAINRFDPLGLEGKPTSGQKKKMKGSLRPLKSKAGQKKRNASVKKQAATEFASQSKVTSQELNSLQKIDPKAHETFTDARQKIAGKYGALKQAVQAKIKKHPENKTALQGAHKIVAKALKEYVDLELKTFKKIETIALKPFVNSELKTFKKIETTAILNAAKSHHNQAIQNIVDSF